MRNSLLQGLSFGNKEKDIWHHQRHQQGAFLFGIKVVFFWHELIQK